LGSTLLLAGLSALAAAPSHVIFDTDISGDCDDAGAGLQRTPTNNPVRRAYELKPYQNRPAFAGSQPSWDQGAALFAVRGAEPEFWGVVGGGRVTVSVEGLTQWQSVSGGQHFYVRIKGVPARLAAYSEALMAQAPAKGERGKPCSS